MTNLAAAFAVSKTKRSKVANDVDSFDAKKSSKKSKANQNVRLNAVIVFLIGTLASVLLTRLVPFKNLEPVKQTLPTSRAAYKAPINATTAINAIDQQDQGNEAMVRPTFTMYAKREKISGKEAINLSIIRKVLKFLGYAEVGIDDDWNLMWGFGTPFPDEKARILKLQPHQIVNHMPGMQFIVSKVILSTSGNRHMPPAFRLPAEKSKFLEYAAENFNKTFIVKGNGHRNVAIKKVQDIDLSSTTTFVQQFLTNPYLVDGYKFDIGVYTVITSIDPLRLYIYTSDVMFRYCQKEFHPFDPEVLDKYVVGDKYRPTWEVPSLVKYFEQFGGGMRASFDAYVRDQGQDPSKIWQQAEEVIRDTILSQAHNIAARSQTYPRKNFFELIRVDMIVDTDFKVHLIEINLSPNMHSKKIPLNNLTFQQLIYNALQLAGVASPVQQADIVGNYSQRLTAVTAHKSVASNLNECVDSDCHRDCEGEGCDLCLSCLDDDDYEILARAHREHTHRADMRRIFPKPIIDVDKFDLKAEIENLSERNKWMIRWFYHKCRYDRSWCQ